MKSIQIGNIHIVVSHVTHFDFSPEEQSEPPIPSSEPKMFGYESKVLQTIIPAHLTVYVDGDKRLEFSDQDAKDGFKLLKDLFS